MLKMISGFLALALFLPRIGFCDPVRFQLSEGSVRIKIPYSLGTHEAILSVAQGLQGELFLDLEKGVLKPVSFKVPLSALKTGNAEMECHLMEALGLNYQKSKYPKQHVCSQENTLPLSGPDQVAYPEVLVQGAEWIIPPEDKKTFLSSDRMLVSFPIQWTVHGVKKETQVPLQVMLGLPVTPPAPLKPAPSAGSIPDIQPLPNASGGPERTLRVQGSQEFTLKDYGIELIPATIVFFTIRVYESVTATFDLLLRAH